jgi:hypothetical protein
VNQSLNVINAGLREWQAVDSGKLTVCVARGIYYLFVSFVALSRRSLPIIQQQTTAGRRALRDVVCRTVSGGKGLSYELSQADSAGKLALVRPVMPNMKGARRFLSAAVGRHAVAHIAAHNKCCLTTLRGGCYLGINSSILS